MTVNDNSGNHASWLWEATSEHCYGCDPHGLGYPGEDYWGQAGYIAHDDSAFYGGVYDFEDGTCINVSGFTDTNGDGCDWYEGRDDYVCDQYGAGARAACCVCGGGLDADAAYDQINFNDTDVKAQAAENIVGPQVEEEDEEEAVATPEEPLVEENVIEQATNNETVVSSGAPVEEPATTAVVDQMQETTAVATGACMT